MKKLLLKVILVIMVSTLSLANNYRIAVIPKGMSHEHWKSVGKGAKRAGNEYGAEIIFRGPRHDDHTESQIAIVTKYINEKVDAIVLAPTQKEELKKYVELAEAKGVKVIIIDSAVSGNTYDSFVATDNYMAGKQAGKELAKLMNKDSKIFLVRYNKGTSSTDEREAGFEEAMKEKGLTISYDKYAGATVGSAFRGLKSFLTENQDIDGIFAPNESSTIGVVRILDSLGLVGKIKMIGFDTSPEILKLIEEGAINGAIEQNPIEMGYIAVKTAIEAIEGAEVDKRIVVDVNYITK